MSLITVLGILVFCGVALYLLNTLVPMDGKIKTILNAVVVLMLLLWLLDVFFGIGTGFGFPRRVH